MRRRARQSVRSRKRNCVRCFVHVCRLSNNLFRKLCFVLPGVQGRLAFLVWRLYPGGGDGAPDVVGALRIIEEGLICTWQQGRGGTAFVLRTRLAFVTTPVDQLSLTFPESTFGLPQRDMEGSAEQMHA